MTDTSARPVLVCPDRLSPTLRAPAVAAAIGRGLMHAGLVDPPPDLCPVSGGGQGTLEVLLTALGGRTDGLSFGGSETTAKTHVGYGLIDDDRTAIIEPDDDPHTTGALIAHAARSGAEMLVLAAADGHATDGHYATDTLTALATAGGTGDARLLVLHGPMLNAASELAAWTQAGAKLVPGPRFILDALAVDVRLHNARCAIIGEARLDRGSLEGRISGALATQARQGGTGTHAICGEIALDRFGARIIDLQVMMSATTLADCEQAGEQLGAMIASGRA